MTVGSSVVRTDVMAGRDGQATQRKGRCDASEMIASVAPPLLRAERVWSTCGACVEDAWNAS